MSQFLKVKTADEVLEILGNLQPLSSEMVDLDAACARVLALPVRAPEPVPHFDKAIMDGYAVRARDTFGASETLPALLDVEGEILMGESASMTVGTGKAVAIPTGGMLPAGADAVVMVEYTSALDGETIEVTKPVAPGDNVLKAGEDIGAGEEMFPAGWRLRPQDIGGLASLGITRVPVYKRPKVAILSTGDEIVEASTRPLPPGKIRDINSFSLAGHIEEADALVTMREIVPDNLDLLVSKCRDALQEHDVLILSGGSSVGARDFTVGILQHFPDSELLVHGVAIRPGKPTIMARIGSKVFWGLPGQPVSAMMICRAFVIPSLMILQGRKATGRTEVAGNALSAVLSRKIPSVHGRTDYFPVILERSDEGLLATPVFGKSAMISTLTKADGYVVIPEHVEGLDQGSSITVYLFSNRLL